MFAVALTLAAAWSLLPRVHVAVCRQLTSDGLATADTCGLMALSVHAERRRLSISIEPLRTLPRA